MIGLPLDQDSVEYILPEILAEDCVWGQERRGNNVGRRLIKEFVFNENIPLYTLNSLVFLSFFKCMKGIIRKTKIFCMVQCRKMGVKIYRYIKKKILHVKYTIRNTENNNNNNNMNQRN